MNTLLPTLVEFLLRLACGLSLAMLITPAKWVTSGFFRVHLWVVMGLGTLVSLAIYSRWSGYPYASWAFGLALAGTVLSYVGAVVWIYEARSLGKALLAIVTALFGFAGAASLQGQTASVAHSLLDFATGSLVLGSFMAAMLLGHWYLNHPGMKLEPIKLLVGLCVVALAARGLLGGVGIAQLAGLGQLPESTIGWSFLAFRWLSGLIGPAVMAWLTWETLKVPNTQSATGILYAAVTLTFLGELTAQLLSRGLPVPV